MAVTSGKTTPAYTPSKAYSAYVTWSLVSQSISGNYSTIRASLYFKTNSYGFTGKTHDLGTVSINGKTYTINDDVNDIPKNATRLIGTIDKQVPHNSDGTKTVTIAGRWYHSGGVSFDLKPTGSFTLPTIKRASVATATPTTQAIGSAIAITTNRQSTSFTHTISYAFMGASGTIASSVGTSHSWTLPTSLLSRLPTSTSGTGTITVKTYSGSSLIGSSTISFKATVPSSYEPSISSLKSSISGTGRDSVIKKYVQGKSRADISFSASAPTGTTIASSSIKVTAGSFSQVMSGSSGKTNLLSNAGTYTITASTKDGRGRTASATATFTVESYAPPTLNSFTAERATTQTNVLTSSSGTFSYLGGSNPLTIELERALAGSSSYSLLKTDSGPSTGKFSTSYTSTGNSAGRSYSFRLSATDSFGAKASSIISVSTAGAALSVHKDVGIGAGKLWERGALDVGGDANFNFPVHHRKNGLVRTENCGAFYGNSSANTGAIVLEVPSGNYMFQAKVSIRSYSYLVNLDLGGYTYTSASTWHNPQASGMTQSPSVKVRFSAGAGEKRYIIIGDTNTAWSGYLQVSVDDFVVGYGTSSGDFKISLTASYPGTTSHTVTIESTDMSKYFNESGGYLGLVGSGGYVRTPSSGLIPYQAGGSGNVGTSGWPFSSIYANAFYEKGTSLESKYLRVISKGGNHDNGYETYSNGYKKVWKTYTATYSGTMSTTGTYGYKSNWIAPGTWYSAFSGVPSVQYTLTTDTAWLWLGPVKKPTATTAGEFFFYKFANSNSYIQLRIEAYGPA